MGKIRCSTAALRDLEQIGDYIAGTLKSPASALNTVNRIIDSIDHLANYSLAGAQLSSVAEIDTDYRLLVCGKYLTFYRIQEGDVYIDRVLYGRRDYLVILFGDLPQDEME